MLKITNMVMVALYLININHIGFEFLRAVVMESSVFWNVMTWTEICIMYISYLVHSSTLKMDSACPLGA
jgi:hypothetical protein